MNRSGIYNPSNNRWSDDEHHVSVDARGALRLSVAKDSRGRWASSGITCTQHLGYGTYRWVVASDLSSIDSNAVLGFFTFDRNAAPSHSEIDIEASRWGNPQAPTGSLTVWQNADKGDQTYNRFLFGRAPYTLQFTWTTERVVYHIEDADGTSLGWTLASGVPHVAHEVPRVKCWRFCNVQPTSTQTFVIPQFAFAAPGQALPPFSDLESAPAPANADGS